ncbi:hypothetical protein CapIbe_000772 [Capra ibex]
MKRQPCNPLTAVPQNTPALPWGPKWLLTKFPSPAWGTRSPPRTLLSQDSVCTSYRTQLNVMGNQNVFITKCDVFAGRFSDETSPTEPLCEPWVFTLLTPPRYKEGYH